jgi:hypothetical protein
MGRERGSNPEVGHLPKPERAYKRGADGKPTKVRATREVPIMKADGSPELRADGTPATRTEKLYSLGKSGLTVGGGVDLDFQDIDRLAISPTLKATLKAKREEFQAYRAGHGLPKDGLVTWSEWEKLNRQASTLVLQRSDRVALESAVFAKKEAEAQRAFDADAAGTKFAELSAGQKTFVADMVYQHGARGAKRFRSFRQAQQGAWEEAATSLRDRAAKVKQDASRNRLRADLLAPAAEGLE